MKGRISTIILICASSIPSIVSADVFITEIMYDREGTDSKREWVEVHNTGADISDFTQYKFLENDVYHGIKESEGGVVLPKDGYAIIADSPSEILSEIPVGTIIFDSAFSLSNKGEVLAVSDIDKNIIDEIFYDVELGAGGDGNSLQKEGNEWIAGKPTPGAGLLTQDTTTVDEAQTISKEGLGDNEVNDQSIHIKMKPIVQDPFTIEIESPEKILAGEVSLFSARAFNSHGDEMLFENYKWNFGDGTIARGKEVSHIYDREGKYVVFVEGNYNMLYDSDRDVITAQKPLISISIIENELEIHNASIKEFDISSWNIISGGLYFTIPQNTFILPRSSLFLKAEKMGLVLGQDTTLMSPSGNFISPILKEEKIIEKNISQPVERVNEIKRDVIQQKPIEHTALINNIPQAEDGGDIPWFILFITILMIGLGVLYFIQKKSTLIDEIEILE